MKNFFQANTANIAGTAKISIVKKSPVFGSTLIELSKKNNSSVPYFVKKCIEKMESPEIIGTDKIYGISGINYFQGTKRITRVR